MENKKNNISIKSKENRNESIELWDRISKAIKNNKLSDFKKLLDKIHIKMIRKQDN